MKIIHFCAGLESWNGMANTARQFVEEELRQGHDSMLTDNVSIVSEAKRIDRLYIQGTWLPVLWKVSMIAKRKGAEVINRPAGNYDPIRLRNGFLKRLKKSMVRPFEIAMLRRADVLLATCEEEAVWIADYAGEWARAKTQLSDLKRFFKLNVPTVRPREVRHGEPLHVLYLGRNDPLKGIKYLHEASDELKRWAISRSSPGVRRNAVDVKVVSSSFGEELDKVWEWTDVLCLPTLSENFGRVVAEAIERGRRVITTDGAPAWRQYLESHPDKGLYLKGYREASERHRVALLKDALKHYADQTNLNAKEGAS